jgi:hypothetical protein
MKPKDQLGSAVGRENDHRIARVSRSIAFSVPDGSAGASTTGLPPE